MGWVERVDHGGWQEVRFATPVHVTVGATYVVSYSAPGNIYAFSHDYFADTGCQTD